MLLYIERRLKAPLQKLDGTVVERTKGVPQGLIIGPVLVKVCPHCGMDKWLGREYPD
jgi:RNA-directed DNA polymerase